MTSRQSLDEVVDKWEVSIIPKGTYIAPNKTTSNASAASAIAAINKASLHHSHNEPLLLGYTGLNTGTISASKERKITNQILNNITNPLTASERGSGSTMLPLPGVASVTGEKKLYLLIEGNNEFKVKQAKLELQRMFDDELIRSSGVAGGGGKYSVL